MGLTTKMFLSAPSVNRFIYPLGKSARKLDIDNTPNLIRQADHSRRTDFPFIFLQSLFSFVKLEIWNNKKTGGKDV